MMSVKSVSLVKKFVILGLAYICFTGITGYLYVSVATESIAFAEKELAGSRALSVLMDAWRTTILPVGSQENG